MQAGRTPHEHRCNDQRTHGALAATSGPETWMHDAEGRMMTIEAVPFLLVLPLVGVAAYTDLRYSKIYNVVTIPAIIIGLALSGLIGGLPGLASSAAGLGIALGMWVLSTICGGCMGGGDIKLLGAIGALCGAKFLLASFVVAVMVGGVVAVATALRHRRFKETARRCVFWGLGKLNRSVTMPLTDQQRSLRVPYGFPIALGVLACLLIPYGLNT